MKTLHLKKPMGEHRHMLRLGMFHFVNRIKRNQRIREWKCADYIAWNSSLNGTFYIDGRCI